MLDSTAAPATSPVLELTGTIVVSGRFVPELVAWPDGWTAEQMAAGTEDVYRADPGALLDVFPITWLGVECRVVPLVDEPPKGGE